jgi:excisionase family DNA binding protein
VEERHFSLSEVARILGKSERTIRRWIKMGRLRAYRPGRDYLIPESALRELMEESEVPKVAPPLPFNQTVEERGRVIVEALQTYINQRAATHEEEVQDPASPHFRDTTSAALWAAMIDQEREALVAAILDESQPLMRNLSADEIVMLVTQLLAPVRKLAEVAEQAEERIAAMHEHPDELAQKRLQENRHKAQELDQRLEERGRVAGM